MVNSREYQAVPREDSEHEYPVRNPKYDEKSSRTALHAGWVRRIQIPVFWASGCFCLMVSVLALVSTRTLSQCTNRDILNYSPAAGAIRYSKVIYPDAVEHKTPFMGEPSPELDAAWVADYDLISRIPKSQADNLDPPSDEIPGDPGYYPVMLDIFHSLHCLNEIRMTMHQDYYGEPHVRHNTTAEKVKRHTDHCLEHIRMALWCNADVSPIPFQDKKGPYGLTALHDYTHTCRDRDSILEWARANKVKEYF